MNIINQNIKIMRDLHDPNNPEYNQETESEFELLMDELTPDALRIIDEEISVYEAHYITLRKIMNAKKSLLNALVTEIESINKMEICFGITPDEFNQRKQLQERLFNLIKSL